MKKKQIEEAIKEAESVITKDDKDEIQKKTENLMKASQKLGELAYSQDQTADNTSNSQSEVNQNGQEDQKDNSKSQTSDDDVVDADFKEVKRG
tara:strand:- start:685 stop:963 length:279 start_codon:yes stop_codon:yes gene_type:complete